MAIVSVIVQFSGEAIEEIIDGLSSIKGIDVFGKKDDRIVAVIEGENIAAIDKTIKKIYSLQNITGVYPIYAGDYE